MRQKTKARIVGLSIVLGIAIGYHFDSWAIGFAVGAGAMLWKT